MILFTRAVARDFRLLFARCVAGRPRGPAPPVVVRVGNGTRTLAATTADGVMLTHASPAPKEPDDLVVLPAAVLAEVEGGTDEAVTLDRQSQVRGAVRWQGGGTPRVLPVELILPGKHHEFPEPPPLAPASPKLLAALHECGRTAARESGRYAISKVQLQGKAGRVVGTDGKVALLWKGFAFPFPDDGLLPALPVFGVKVLTRLTNVRLGRTESHLVVGVGPWAVWLPADPGAKFPDVAGVVPRHAPTTVDLDGADADSLLAILSGLPGGDHDLRPVTLEADGAVRVRGRAEDGEKAGEVRQATLARSAVAGPAVRVVLDRRVLARALALGCLTLKLTPGKPVAAEGDGVTLVAAQLDPALAAPPADEPEPTPTPPEPKRRLTMKPETNGHTPPRGDSADPLELAEELRAALAEAAGKAARLVALLRQSKKEKKVLSAVLTNLKQLALDDGGAR